MFMYTLASELESGLRPLSFFFKRFNWGCPPYREEQLPLYVAFMEQIVNLETAGIPWQLIVKGVQHEKQLIDLLEGPQDSAVLLDGWAQSGRDHQRLFFSRYDIGVDLEAECIQGLRDFSTVTQEALFSKTVMEEDAFNLLRECLKDRAYMLHRLNRRAKRLRRTLEWAKQFER